MYEFNLGQSAVEMIFKNSDLGKRILKNESDIHKDKLKVKVEAVIETVEIHF